LNLIQYIKKGWFWPEGQEPAKWRGVEGVYGASLASSSDWDKERLYANTRKAFLKTIF